MALLGGKGLKALALRLLFDFPMEFPVTLLRVGIDIYIPANSHALGVSLTPAG